MKLICQTLHRVVAGNSKASAHVVEDARLLEKFSYAPPGRMRMMTMRMEEKEE